MTMSDPRTNGVRAVSADPVPAGSSPVHGEISLRIDGDAHQLTVDTRATLLDLLREGLGVTGAKKGCDHDLAEYHIAVSADVAGPQAHWIDEHDPYVNAMGAKGIGVIGIVGTRRGHHQRRPPGHRRPSASAAGHLRQAPRGSALSRPRWRRAPPRPASSSSELGTGHPNPHTGSDELRGDRLQAGR